MFLHPNSHCDHLPPTVLDWLLAKFQDRQEAFKETVELPPDLPAVECGLHGPAVGDPPVPEEEVYYTRRGDRRYQSRLCPRWSRPTRTVTVIAGPYRDFDCPFQTFYACVLYTAFGGPLAPKEPSDPSLTPEEERESREFWLVHALSPQRGN